MSPSYRLLRVVSALVLFLLLMTGCRPAMSDPTTATTTPTIQPPAPTHEVPLHFVLHDFEALCFNTIGCKVAYAGRYQVNDAPDKVSPPPPADLNQLWGPGEGGIRNFPPPAEVSWKSLDGVAHEAKIDFAALFKEQLIWHNVPKADMADFYKGPVAGDPHIYLEINDHIVNVYMSMAIPTKTEQIPGNKYSYDREDFFLAWTRTY
jgi:hypothetical protein